MADYIPPALDWVREQVELYESSGGTQGTTLLDTGMPCILVTLSGAWLHSELTERNQNVSN